MAFQKLRKYRPYEVSHKSLLRKPTWYYTELTHDEPSCFGEMIALFDQCSMEAPHCERCPVFWECRALCDKDWWTMRHRGSILAQLESFKETKNQHIELTIFQGIPEWLHRKSPLPHTPSPLEGEGEGDCNLKVYGEGEGEGNETKLHEITKIVTKKVTTL